MSDSRTFPRSLVEGMMREQKPEMHAIVQQLPEEVQADVYDRIGRAWWAAFERAVLYGTRANKGGQPTGLAQAPANKTDPGAGANKTP